MDYARAVRVLRAARNFSQKDLALNVGVEAAYLSMIEAGKRKPGRDLVERLSKACGVPVSLFFLLASESKDLQGVSADQANLLGKQLLDLLVTTGD